MYYQKGFFFSKVLRTVVNVVPLSLQIAQINDKKLQRDNKYLLSITILVSPFNPKSVTILTYIPCSLPDTIMGGNNPSIVSASTFHGL